MSLRRRHRSLSYAPLGTSLAGGRCSSEIRRCESRYEARPTPAPTHALAAADLPKPRAGSRFPRSFRPVCPGRVLLRVCYAISVWRASGEYSRRALERPDSLGSVTRYAARQTELGEPDPGFLGAARGRRWRAVLPLFLSRPR